MPAQFRPDPPDAPLPFIPDKEPRFVLSIPFSNTPFIHIADPFPLPHLRATSSEQDIARQLLERSPSPSPSADRPNPYGLDYDYEAQPEPQPLGWSPSPSANRSHSPSTDQPHAGGFDNRLQPKPPAVLKDNLKRSRPQSPSPIPSSSICSSPPVSGESAAMRVNSKEKLKSKEKSPEKEAQGRRSGEQSKRRRVPDTIDPLYACPKQKRIYDCGSFTWYEAQGHQPLLAPPLPPTNPGTIIHNGDMLVYKLLDNSSAQAWLWDESCQDLNPDKGFWCPVEKGQSRNIRGRTYIFEFGKDFSPHWTSQLTIERRAQRRVRAVFLDS